MFNFFNKKHIKKSKLKFDFAFSFSGGETRQKVVDIAEKLKKFGFEVFVDIWYTKEMQQVSHPKDYLTEVFTNAKYVILILNKAYMYEFEKKSNCNKNFNTKDGCYVKHEVKIISQRLKKETRFLMKIQTEDINLENFPINYDTPLHNLSLREILNFFGYQHLLTKKYENTKENKLQIKEKIEKLFTFHNIYLEEWPLVIKEFTYDVIEKNKFYEVINPNLINIIANKFKVNEQIFYNNDDKFYNIHRYGFYKNVKSFSDYVYNKIYKKNGKMYIISKKTPDKEIDEKNKNNRFALIFRIPLFEINNKQIYTYEIYDDSCDWGYWKCRYNLKSFLLCLRGKGIFDSFWQGSVVTNEKSLYENLEDFASGNIKFESFINKIDWYPEDFIDTPQQNIRAKEYDELEKIKDKKCESFY